MCPYPFTCSCQHIYEIILWQGLGRIKCWFLGWLCQELKNIYGQQDDKEGAKKELMVLWVNKDLARKNFVKYAEWYRTLARIVNYSNEIHIDKMKEVIPDELWNALVIYEITNQSPKTWDNYLKLLMQAYKALHLDKTQGTIFGPEAIGEKSGGKKEDRKSVV